jgi:hypothetical protein
MTNTIWMDKSSGSTWLLIGWNSNKNTMTFEGLEEIEMKLTAKKHLNMFDALEHEYAFIGNLD